jgi:hypothetical protein
MQIIDETPANFLVQEDGDIRSIGRSKLNRALVEQDLWGLLRDGDEILNLRADDQPKVTLIPHEGGNEFELQIGEERQVHLGPHHKSQVVDILVDHEKSEPKIKSLVSLYDEIREDMVRKEIMEYIAEREPFANHVVANESGWLIHDHLLLTWETEFYHPNTTTYDRSGSVIGEGLSERAYRVNIDRITDDIDRRMELDGEVYYLTESEMEFLAKGLWAAANAPRDV